MSREEAIEILSDMRAEYNLFGDEEEATRYHVLSWAIKEMKATQPERRKGKWIEVKNKWGGLEIRCSECGAQVPRDAWGNAMQCDYCPNCGARMEGEDDDICRRL